MRGIFGLSLQQHLMAGAAIVAVASASPAQAQTKSFDVPAQSASQGIPAFAKQAGVQIIASGNLVRDRRTNAVKCTCTVEEGLRKLLDGTGLTAGSPGATGIITVVSAVGNANVAVTASDGDSDASSGDASSDQAGISEILVVGTKTQNVDIRRSEDDPLPYVVFQAEEIQRSNVNNVDDFLRTRLPMNQARRGEQETQSGTGLVDLRGLGPLQTLILVDGRRIPGAPFGGGVSLAQSRLTSIPLSAVERIEVLPASAGAIYGGSATGGVVNIILKRDYRNITLEASYGNTDGFDMGEEKYYATAGAKVAGFDVMLTGSYMDTGNLLSSEIDYFDRSTQLLLKNAPDVIVRPSPPNSPYIGRTPNICSAVPNTLTCTSTPLVLDNGTPLNSNITHVPVGYAGPTVAGDGGAAFLATAGSYNYDNKEPGFTVLGAQERITFGANIRRRLGDHVELFTDFAWAKNKYHGFQSPFQLPARLAANHPDNPFQQAIRVNYVVSQIRGEDSSESKEIRGTAGAIVRLPHDWSVSVEKSKGRSEFSSLTTTPGVLAGPYLADTNLQGMALADTSVFFAAVEPYIRFSESERLPQDITADSISAHFAGPLAGLPGGKLVLSGLLQQSKDRLDDAFFRTFTGTTGSTSYSWAPKRSQTVRSAYAEIRAPIFSPKNARRGLHELELQASIRTEKYDRVGQTGTFFLADLDDPRPDVEYATNKFGSTDYLIAASYAPVRSIKFRASYSTAFLPVSLVSLQPFSRDYPNSINGFLTLQDPKRGNTAVATDPLGAIPGTSGGNPDAKPETSKSLTIGTIITPEFAPDLRLSVQYVRIRKKDEAYSPPTLSQNLLLLEDLLPGVITRGPNLPGDQPGWAGPIISFNSQLRNAAKSEYEAIDFQIDDSFKMQKLGELHIYGLATLQTKAAIQLAPNLGLVDRVGFSDGGIKFRGNFGFDWIKGPWSVGWNSQFYGKSKIYPSNALGPDIAELLRRQGSLKLPAQIYSDVYAEYKFDSDSPIFRGLELMAGVQNIFDKSPPILASGVAPSFADLRLRRFTLTIRKAIRL